MIGSIIGAGMQAAGAIWGGISAAKSAKKVKQNIEEQKQKNQDWYDRRYNEDPTQRADAVRLLTMTEESIKKRNKAAAGSAAVMPRARRDSGEFRPPRKERRIGATVRASATTFRGRPPDKPPPRRTGEKARLRPGVRGFPENDPNANERRRRRGRRRKRPSSGGRACRRGAKNERART